MPSTDKCFRADKLPVSDATITGLSSHQVTSQGRGASLCGIRLIDSAPLPYLVEEQLNLRTHPILPPVEAVHLPRPEQGQPFRAVVTAIALGASLLKNPASVSSCPPGRCGARHRRSRSRRRGRGMFGRRGRTSLCCLANFICVVMTSVCVSFADVIWRTGWAR